MVTFSSVGDIISVSLLVKDLLIAINSSKGAASEYQEVVRELYVLDVALLEVERLARTHEATPELHALCEIARRSVDKSRILVGSFTERINKYNRSLHDKSKANVLKHAARSVQWQLSRDDVDRFRAEIMSHTHSIQMLVSTAQVAILQVGNKDLTKRISDAETNASAAQSQTNDMLTEIRDKIEDNKRLISDGNSLKSQMLQRFKWFAQLGTEIKRHVQTIMQTQFNIYREVVFIRKRLVSSPGRSFDEDPFLLEDALGRVSPVHLRFINSWTAFEAVIVARFEGRAGYSKIKRRDYVLADHGNGKEIHRDMDWEIAIMPGQRVNMSVIFREREAASTEPQPQNAICPHCHAVASHSTGRDTQCPQCERWFSRIVEIFDDEPEQKHTTKQAPPRPPTFGQPAFRDLPILTKPAPKRPLEIDSDDDDESDMTGFMRIRLVARQKRRRVATAFDSNHAAAFAVGADAVDAPLWSTSSSDQDAFGPGFGTLMSAALGPRPAGVDLHDEESDSEIRQADEPPATRPHSPEIADDLATPSADRLEPPLSTAEVTGSMDNDFEMQDKPLSAPTEAGVEANANANANANVDNSVEDDEPWKAFSLGQKTSKKKKSTAKVHDKTQDQQNVQTTEEIPMLLFHDDRENVLEDNVSWSWGAVSTSKKKKTKKRNSDVWTQLEEDTPMSNASEHELVPESNGSGTATEDKSEQKKQTRENKTKTTQPIPTEAHATAHSPRRPTGNYGYPVYTSSSSAGYSYYQPRYDYTTSYTYSSPYGYDTARRTTSGYKSPSYYTYSSPYGYDTAKRTTSVYKSPSYYPYSYSTDTPDPRYEWYYERSSPRRISYYTSTSSYKKGNEARATTSRVSKPKPAKPRQATEEDARRAHIPEGYAIRHWDPDEEPILLFGSVFDANSLGKWIYDWMVYIYGAATPLAEVAGDLWLLLIQLSGKITRAENAMHRIRLNEDRDMVDEFLDSGERIWQRLNKLLKRCESHAWEALKTRQNTDDDSKPSKSAPKMAEDLLGFMFGREHDLERTERFMTSIRLWSIRFDAHCGNIIQKAQRLLAPSARTELPNEADTEPHAPQEESLPRAPSPPDTTCPTTDKEMTSKPESAHQDSQADCPDNDDIVEIIEESKISASAPSFDDPIMPCSRDDGNVNTAQHSSSIPSRLDSRSTSPVVSTRAEADTQSSAARPPAPGTCEEASRKRKHTPDPPDDVGIDSLKKRARSDRDAEHVADEFMGDAIAVVS